MNLLRRLRKRGITAAEYADLLERQGGVCAICRDPNRALDIDHDHGDGLVRGLLCGPCNRGIGFMDDDAARLRAAIVYLEGA